MRSDFQTPNRPESAGLRRPTRHKIPKADISYTEPGFATEKVEKKQVSKKFMER